MRNISAKVIFAFLCLILSIGSLRAQQILSDLPKQVDKNKYYLFYLHGRIIEVKGMRPTDEKYGVYEYQQILDTLASKGFIEISEVRKDTSRVKYAQKVVIQIKDLLQAGIPPSQITVVGASKGAVITMMISTQLKNNQVNFVPMAGCNEMIYQRFTFNLYGNVLSIYDSSDIIAGSCKQFFTHPQGLKRHKEIELQLGIGHGLLYKPYKEWVDLVVQWGAVGCSGQKEPYKIGLKKMNIKTAEIPLKR
jgi:hypothetical protein